VNFYYCLHSSIQFKMDCVVQHRPSEVLGQVASSMRWHDDRTTVELPVVTTYHTAIRAVESATTDISFRLSNMPRHKRKELLRQKARRDALLSTSTSKLPLQERPLQALPIRSNVKPRPITSADRASGARKERLKENAAMMKDTFDSALLTFPVSLVDRTLATVEGNVTVDGLDIAFKDGGVSIEDIKMLWDMGAQTTIISEEILPHSFREFLKDPAHDIYRSPDGFRVQVDISIAFTNASPILSSVALVVPKDRLPNKFEGVIFGQSGCIDRLACRSIPREILRARGSDIGDDMWGEIILEEYLDLDEKLVSF